jgi:hypothetical protein
VTDFDDFNDDLAGIFDGISPEDFLQRETTAIGVVSLASQDDQFVGEAAFARFVARSLATVRTSYAAAEGEVNPVAILATGEKQYIFVPDEDDDMGSWTDRLRREVTSLGATWVFICRKTIVGAAEDQNPDRMPELGDPDVFELASTRGRMRPGVLFYCQRREGYEVENHHGYLHATSDTELGDVVMGKAGQTFSMFNVLG